MWEHADQPHARDRQLLGEGEARGGAQTTDPARAIAGRVGGRGRGGGGGLEETLLLPARAVGGGAQRLCTATRSHTKMRVSPGAMTGGAPWSP